MSNPFAFRPSAETLAALHGLATHPAAMAASDCTTDQSTREGDDAIALLVATIETYYWGWSMICPPPPITKSSEASARHQRATSDRVELIKAKAPAAPPCFGYRDTWLGWLHAAETSNDVRVFKWKGRTGAGEQHRGRIKTEEFSESIDFCKDCTGEYKRQMQACGRCLHSSQRPTDQPGIEVGTEMSSMCLSSGLVRKTA